MENVTRPTYRHPDKRRRPAAPRVAFAPPTGEVAKAPNPAISTLVSQVDPVRLLDTVTSLAAVPTRHSLSPNNKVAAGWLREQFLALGYTDVSLEAFPVGGVTRHNVVCTKHGTTEPAKFIVVGAHFDSRMSALSNSTAVAPGADDNASGVAALLELGRLIWSTSLALSVRFVAFSGEEQGLVGSTVHAEAAHAVEQDIRLMINLDMIGHPADPAHPTIVVERDMGNDTPANDAASQAAATRMAEAAATYTSLHADLGPIYQSDYMPFEHYGYVCIGAFDGADSQPFYHSATDTPDKVNASFLADVVRMVLATVVDIAGA